MQAMTIGDLKGASSLYSYSSAGAGVVQRLLSLYRFTNSGSVCSTITVTRLADQLEELEALQAIMGEDICVDLEARSCEVLLQRLVNEPVSRLPLN